MIKIKEMAPGDFCIEADRRGATRFMHELEPLLDDADPDDGIFHVRFHLHTDMEPLCQR